MDLALILNNLVKKSHRLKTLITANYQATQYDTLILDSSTQPFQVTLPPDPMIGSRLILFDAGGNLSNNNVTLDGNGKNINTFSTYKIQNNYNVYQVTYYNSVKGWRITAGIALSDLSNESGISIGGTSGSGSVTGSCCEPLVDQTPELIYSLDNDIVMSL